MDAYTGEIRMFAGNYAPADWAFCNGQILNIEAYTPLFALIGNCYGGDAQQKTFALPNLQGQVPMHWGTAPSGTKYTWGETGGTETVTLTTAEMPIHGHALSASAADGNQTSPHLNFISSAAEPSSGTPINLFSTSANTIMNPASVTQEGGGMAHNNMQPYQCVSFIICLNGYWPSRG